MKMNRTTPVADYQSASKFDELCRRLRNGDRADRLDKPLAYWTQPSDRSTPIALIGRTVRNLISTPFAELCATPGIGQKKIAGLLRLLERAAQPQPPGAAPPAKKDAAVDAFQMVDAADVSEALWVEWRASVQRHKLGREALGRLAPSLAELPRVIWNTPLDVYTGLTLAQIRALKTHGEKRVRAVVQVFGALHSIVGRVGDKGNLEVAIKPRVIAEVEAWMHAVLARDSGPDLAELRRRMVDPLMAQVRIDLGDHIADLADSRLGLDGNGVSVRQVARRLQLTRARVYQLLADVGAALAVRWPDAGPLAMALRQHVEATGADRATLELFAAAMDLFFPSTRSEADAGGEEDDADALDARVALAV